MRYLRPLTLEQAVANVAEGGTPLAGGTVLVPEIKLMPGEAMTLVDIGRIEALRELKVYGGYIHVGAMVKLASLAAAPAELKDQATALVQAAAAVGNPQVRRAATVGGNLGVGIPGADLPPALLVFDAEAIILSAAGEESRAVERIVRDGVPKGSLILAVQAPLQAGLRSGFRKFAWRRASGKTIVNLAAALQLENGRVTAARLAAGGLSRAARLPQTEKLLQDRAWDETLAEAAAATAAAEAIFDAPLPPGEKYRRKLIHAGMRQLLMEIAKS